MSLTLPYSILKRDIKSSLISYAGRDDIVRRLPTSIRNDLFDFNVEVVTVLDVLHFLFRNGVSRELCVEYIVRFFRSRNDLSCDEYFNDLLRAVFYSSFFDTRSLRFITTSAWVTGDLVSELVPIYLDDSDSESSVGGKRPCCEPVCESRGPFVFETPADLGQPVFENFLTGQTALFTFSLYDGSDQPGS